MIAGTEYRSLHLSRIELEPDGAHISRALCEKWDDERCGDDDLGTDDQDFGRGRDIVTQNPTSHKIREKWGTLSLFTDEKWASPPIRPVWNHEAA